MAKLPTRPRLDAALLREACAHLRGSDPLLGAVIDRVGPCGIRVELDPYRMLVRSVMHQQLAGAAARAIDARLRAHFGGRIPAPAKLVAAEPAELRKLGLSGAKAASIQDIARAFADKRLDSRKLRRMDDAQVIEAVTPLRGVGEWTAHMLLIFSLGRPDVLPVGDYGVRKGARALYALDELPRPAELESLGEKWRPYRSVAIWYLWRYTELE